MLLDEDEFCMCIFFFYNNILFYFMVKIYVMCVRGYDNVLIFVFIELRIKYLKNIFVFLKYKINKIKLLWYG